jgi:hydroxypyruvate isomerase
MDYGLCLEMVFTDRPFAQRIALAAEAGFRFAEFWFVDRLLDDSVPVNSTDGVRALRKAADHAAVTLTNTVVGSPDGSLGGGLVQPAHRQTWLDRVRMTLQFNQAAGIPATIVCTGNVVEAMAPDEMQASVLDGLKATADLAEQYGVTLLLEPLNTRVDHPGYFLTGSDAGADLCRAVGSDRLRLLYDCYHMQIMEGDLTAHVRRNLDVIGHFHSAGVPGRHELFNGEVDYPFLTGQIEDMGYEGVFGLEYAPSMDDMQSLKRTLQHLGVA